MATTASKSFSLSNSSQKLPFLAVLIYALYGHPRYFKFKQKYQQYGPCFQTIFPFLVIMVVLYIEAIRTISKLFFFIFYFLFFIFFEEKILRAQKYVTSKNQLTKQKKANTKQQRQQLFTPA